MPSGVHADCSATFTSPSARAPSITCCRYAASPPGAACAGAAAADCGALLAAAPGGEPALGAAAGEVAAAPHATSARPIMPTASLRHIAVPPRTPGPTGAPSPPAG